MSSFGNRSRDRRRLGVNFFSVLRAAKKVAEDPEFEPDSALEMAETILANIVGKDLPQAKADMPEIDWDSLLAFIMKILPLILKLLALF